jgi:hypothetical protein
VVFAPWSRWSSVGVPPREREPIGLWARTASTSSLTSRSSFTLFIGATVRSVTRTDGQMAVLAAATAVTLVRDARPAGLRCAAGRRARRRAAQTRS